MNDRSKTVLVAGAGPVGLACALELTRLGRAVRIVDKKAGPSTESKAIAVNSRSLDLLEPSGVTPRIIAAGVKVLRANLHSGDRRIATLDFSGLDHRYSFAIALPQSETEKLLAAELAERGVAVEWGTEMTAFGQDANAVHAVLVKDGRQETLETPYLVGADGAHSTVRHLLKLEFPGAAYENLWQVLDVRMDGPWGHDEVNVRFLRDGGLFFAIPIPGENLYRIAVNRPEEPAELAPTGTVIHETLWQSEFRIHHRVVGSFAMGRCFLCGDAAHIHSPAGGRGMNMGIEDATTLARRIVGGGVEGYAAQRLPIAKRVVAQTDRLTRMAMISKPLPRALRDTVVPIVTALPPVKRFLARENMGLNTA
jgi:2-polyprenyl-6-methoxyphenol hydroxylase-like FAD-dependent oxidoreductase